MRKLLRDTGLQLPAEDAEEDVCMH